MAKDDVCMLASEYKGWPKGEEGHVLVQPKLDGFRLVVKFDAEGNRSYYCRKPKPVPWAENLGHIDNELATLDLRNCMLDGEVVASNWNELASLVKKQRKNLTDEQKDTIRHVVQFAVFDLVYDDDENMTQEKRHWRVHRLLAGYEKDLCVLYPVDSYRAYDEMGVQECYGDWLAQGYEGAMVKLVGALYESGKRSKGWLKLKPHSTREYVIEAVLEGEGKCKGVCGALVCVGGVHVGTGMDDAKRAELWARREEIVGTLVEVKVQDGDVAVARHPVFVRLREDQS